MSHAPSSSSAGLSFEVNEPWQLQARFGASLLAVGLTLPALVGVLTTVSVVLLGPDVPSWTVLSGAGRVLHVASMAVVLLSIVRLASAPAVDAGMKLGALLMVVCGWLGQLLSTSVLADNPRASLFAVFVWQVCSIVGTFAVIAVCRRIDNSLTDDAPWPLWGATFLLAAGAALARGLPLLMPDANVIASALCSIFALASFATTLAGVMRLRRRLA